MGDSLLEVLVVGEGPGGGGERSWDYDMLCDSSLHLVDLILTLSIDYWFGSIS